MSSAPERSAREHGGRRRWYLLLALPFIGLLYPPLYATKDPEVFGIPFFYWYQFAWVVVASAITILVYTRTRAES
jgi:hypothetical protein